MNAMIFEYCDTIDTLLLLECWYKYCS